MPDRDIILALASGLIGSLIGGLIAIKSAMQSVARMECLCRSARLKNLLREVIVKLDTVPHPCVVTESREIDNAVADLIAVMPFFSRYRYLRAWNKYRYEPNKNYIPFEYTKKKSHEVKKLIIWRLNHLINLLNKIA